MNKIQKYFLIGWIPCTIFMFINVWSFITPGSIGYKYVTASGGMVSYRTEYIYSWDGIIIYLIFIVLLSTFAYHRLTYQDNPVRLWFTRWMGDEEKPGRKKG